MHKKKEKKKSRRICKLHTLLKRLVPELDARINLLAGARAECDVERSDCACP